MEVRRRPNVGNRAESDSPAWIVRTGRVSEGPFVEQSPQLCPYLDRQDARCDGVLTLTNLRVALTRCAGEHKYCSVYHRIRLGELGRDLVDLPVARSA